MKRRTAVKTILGTTIGSKFILEHCEPTLSASFELSSIPAADPTSVKSIQISMNDLDIKTAYTDTNEEFTVIYEVKIDGYPTKSQEVQTKLDRENTISDLQNANPDFGTITLDGIEESQSTLSGNVRIKIQGSSISKEDKRTFTISAEDIAKSLTTSATLNNQSIKVSVLEDLDGTGTYDNTENIYIDDGSNTYDLTNIEGGAKNRYKVTADLETTDVNQTPILKSIDLKEVLSLSNDADWDSIPSSSGIVHENVSNTDQNDATEVKKGYSIQNPLFKNSLIGYWPLQEDQGSTSYDFSNNSNNGTINGPTIGSEGLIGTSSYNFNSSNAQNVIIPNNSDYGGINEITISA